MALRKLAALLAATCALSSVSAQAERLAIEGIYAAHTDAASGVVEIVLEPFLGREGYELETAVASQLNDARIHGDPVFRIVPAGPDSGRAEPGRAVFRAYGGSDITEIPDGVIERTSCLRKEKVGKKERKKCVESVTETFECRRLHVAFDPDVALIADEGTLYRRFDRLESSERYCADNSYVPSVEALLDPMIASFAQQVRLDLAPQQRVDKLRIFESRKGLEGEDRKAFKAAIKLTKHDPMGACVAFEEVLSRNPSHRSALYNAALCHEAEGRLDLAAETYSLLTLTYNDARFLDGMARVESRMLAQEQLAVMEQNRLAFAASEERDVAE